MLYIFTFYVDVAITKNKVNSFDNESLHLKMLFTDRICKKCLYKKPTITFLVVWFGMETGKTSLTKKIWWNDDLKIILYSLILSFLGLRFVWWPNNMPFPRRGLPIKSCKRWKTSWWRYWKTTLPSIIWSRNILSVWIILIFDSIPYIIHVSNGICYQNCSDLPYCENFFSSSDMIGKNSERSEQIFCNRMLF